MKHKNVSRNALVTSIIFMLLCVSMLVGTTFAWFTDSVTSGVNTIAAGNLDVELYHDKANEFADLDKFKVNAQYTSYCVVLQDDGTYKAENNTLVIDNCEFLYSGVDNYNSSIDSVSDRGNGANGNTVTVTNCTYGEKVVAY